MNPRLDELSPRRLLIRAYLFCLALPDRRRRRLGRRRRSRPVGLFRPRLGQETQTERPSAAPAAAPSGAHGPADVASGAVSGPVSGPDPDQRRPPAVAGQVQPGEHCRREQQQASTPGKFRIMPNLASSPLRITNTPHCSSGLPAEPGAGEARRQRPLGQHRRRPGRQRVRHDLRAPREPRHGRRDQVRVRG